MDKLYISTDLIKKFKTEGWSYLTPEEFHCLYNYYKDLINEISYLDDEFYLFKKEIRATLELLETYGIKEGLVKI